MITVKGLKCGDCGDIIYSRAHHDWRPCSCGNIFVDGGFDYFRCGWKNDNFEHIDVKVDATREELFADWNSFGEDKFGIIKNDES